MFHVQPATGAGWLRLARTENIKRGRPAEARDRAWLALSSTPSLLVYLRRHGVGAGCCCPSLQRVRPAEQSGTPDQVCPPSFAFAKASEALANEFSVHPPPPQHPSLRIPPWPVLSGTLAERCSSPGKRGGRFGLTEEVTTNERRRRSVGAKLGNERIIFEVKSC